MKARIDFEVENEEEFEKLKECSKLPDERWSLEKEDIELNKLIDMKTCYVDEEDVIVELPKDKDGIEINSNDIYLPIIHKEDVERLLDRVKKEQDKKVKKLKEEINKLTIFTKTSESPILVRRAYVFDRINKIFGDNFK